jgi:hypothetical protein
MTTNTANEKAPGLPSEGSKKVTNTSADSTSASPTQIELKLEFKPETPVTKKRKFSRKSTATKAQHDRIDRAFDYPGKLISTIDFRRMGVIHPAGRIKEMNEKLDYFIATVELRTVVDEQGYPHPRIAFYQLIDRPKEGGQHHV